MPFNRIKGINGSSNIDMRNLCLVFKRDVDLSSEVSETSINYNNKFTNMKFSSFYRSPLSLVEYVGKTGSNIKYNEVLNIQENSNIPLNGLISFDNFKNTKQYDILECDFNKTTDNECKNINFFNDIKASVGTRIQQLNNSVDIIKYKILPGTEIISDNINTGAIDINFQDNIFTNLIMIDIYTDRLITGDHGDAVSGYGANGYNGGSGSNGNNGGPAILFKNITNSQLKAYVYENGTKISGGFGSSGGNGGNAGKPGYNTTGVNFKAQVDEVKAKWEEVITSTTPLLLSDYGWVHRGFWTTSDGNGNWYYALLNNNSTKADIPLDSRYLGLSLTQYSDIKALMTKLSSEFSLIPHVSLNGWTHMSISETGTVNTDKKAKLTEWIDATNSPNGWSEGDRNGYAFSAKVTYYKYRSDNNNVTASFGGVVTQLQNYVAFSAQVNKIKAHNQTETGAKAATKGTFATPRIDNALTIFTAIKGSNGSDAPANAIDNLLKAAGNPGIGGNPGGNGREILTTPLTIFNDLIRI